MSIFLRRFQQARAGRSNRISIIVENLVLILMILLIPGCALQTGDANPANSQSTQPPGSIQTVGPDSKAGNNIPDTDASPTASPAAAPANTEGPVVSLTFIPDADAYVKQSEPDTNFGDKTSLKVDGGDVDESFVRFTITEVSGPVHRALLRLYNTTNGSRNGPAVYATGASWSEDEITWNNRPIHSDEALDNKTEVGKESWVEYDVTSALMGTGTLSFILAADSEDAVSFSSREGSQPPELVVTFASDGSVVPPPTVSVEDVVFVGAGDISMCDNENDELTAQLLDNFPGTVFTTGDNAYDDGTYEQFMDCYDPTWGRHKDRTFPVPGNHEYHTADAGGYFQYFDNIASYYAYNLGSWRIYALNTEIDVTEDSPQIKWLQEDLEAHPSQCVLAYWHQPRWSSGSTHGNSRRIQTLWQILHDAGAELVLNGHEHNYERFMPMDSKGLANPLGLREFVIGSGGAALYPFGDPLPTSEVRHNSSHGILKLTLRSGSYDWQFVPVPGSTFTDSGSTACH